MSYKPFIEPSKSAFEDVLTAELTPIVNVEFSYNLHPEIVTTRLNNGAASVDSSRAKLSTGAVANQSAQLLTNVPVKYYAGIGVVARFTAIFPVPKTGSFQWIGIGDSGDGLFIGNNELTFGVLRRYGGNPEIRSLQITTASTTAENITITLDGNADATVAVTNSGNVTTTANEIAAHDYSNLGRGWIAIANGDTINFISFNSASRAGSYAIAGTTVVGAYTQKIAGVAQDDTDFTAQASWSDDAMDGNGDSGITLDHEKGNPFQIVFGWLGFDAIAFFIKNPETRRWILFHIIEYSNANVLPSLNNPTLPLCAVTENTTNNTDMVMYVSSMGGFIQGKKPEPVIDHVHIVDITFTSTTVVPAITLHNNGVFQSKINHVRMRIKTVSVVVESGKPVVIEVIKDAELTDASFSEHEAGSSVALFDVAASAVSGGEIIKAFPASVDKDKVVDKYVEPTKFITIAGAQAVGGTNSVCKIIVEWEEDH